MIRTRTFLALALAAAVLAPTAALADTGHPTSSTIWVGKQAPALLCQAHADHLPWKHDAHMVGVFGWADCSSSTQMRTTVTAQVMTGSMYRDVYPTFVDVHYGTLATVYGNVQCPPPASSRLWRAHVVVYAGGGAGSTYSKPGADLLLGTRRIGGTRRVVRWTLRA